jgi:hypothetical protein
MKTCTSSTRMNRRNWGGGVAMPAAVVALGVAGLLGGCATTGGGSGVAGAGAEAASRAPATADAPAAGLVERDFYADWYDSTAVVLPPPPGGEKARR